MYAVFDCIYVCVAVHIVCRCCVHVRVFIWVFFTLLLCCYQDQWCGCCFIAQDAHKELFLDMLTKEEKEALLTKKMEDLRRQNEAIQKRYEVSLQLQT